MTELRADAVKARPIRVGDVLVAFNPLDGTADSSARTDTLAELVATILKNPTGTLTATEQTTFRDAICAAKATTAVPVNPPVTIDVRVVWSGDRTTTATELAMGESFSSNTFAIPANTGFAYLVIWRADANGGAPSGVRFDGQPQRGAFGDGTDLTTSDGVDGEYIVSLVQLDGDDIGGDEMRLS